MSKKFLIPIGNTFRLVEEYDLLDLKLDPMISLAVLLVKIQRSQLYADARFGKDRTYHGRKVVDALEQTLSKLDEAVPGLSVYVHKLLAFTN